MTRIVLCQALKLLILSITQHRKSDLQGSLPTEMENYITGLDICVRRTMCNLIRSPDGHEAVGFELCLSVTDHAAYPEYLWRKGAASLGGFEEIGQLSEDQLSGRSIGISTHCLDKIGTEIKGSQSCQTGGRWWQWYLCSKPIRAKEKYTDSWLPGHRCARVRFYCISLYVIVQNPLL